jgi:hypothetical protein
MHRFGTPQAVPVPVPGGQRHAVPLGGPDLGDNYDDNVKIFTAWIDRSFEPVVRQFVGEQLPGGVSIPDSLFEDTFGMLNLIHAIQARSAPK